MRLSLWPVSVCEAFLNPSRSQVPSRYVIPVTLPALQCHLRVYKVPPDGDRVCLVPRMATGTEARRICVEGVNLDVFLWSVCPSFPNLGFLSLARAQKVFPTPTLHCCGTFFAAVLTVFSLLPNPPKICWF